MGMTDTNTASGAADLTDTVCKALRRSWQLGQTYWQQADSESFIQHKKSETTHAAFVALLDDTRAALASAPAQPVAEPAEVSAVESNTAGAAIAAGAVYAELPMQFACSGVFPVYSADQMRAFADGTHALRTKSEASREFLERMLSAMEGVIDVADRKTAEFDALRSCVVDLTLMLFKPEALRASRGLAPAGAAPDDQMIIEYGIKASRMMARDLTRFDAACEVDKYLREEGAPGYYRHRMSIILFGNVEGTEASRAPENEAPQPSPTPQADSQPAPLREGEWINDAGRIKWLLWRVQDLEAKLAARAPADSVLEDAARYRWIRGPVEESTRYSRWRIEYWDGPNGWQPMQRERMDSAIDAARKQGGA